MTKPTYRIDNRPYVPLVYKLESSENTPQPEYIFYCAVIDLSTGELDEVKADCEYV